MRLTLLRERSTAFPAVVPFRRHPVGERRSSLPSGVASWLAPAHFDARIFPQTPRPALVLSLTQHSVLSTQYFTLSLIRSRAREAKRIEKAFFR